MDFFLTTPDGVKAIQENGTSFPLFLDGGFNFDLVDSYTGYFLSYINDFLCRRLYGIDDGVSFDIPTWALTKIQNYIQPYGDAFKIDTYLRNAYDKLPSMVNVYVEGNIVIIELDRALLTAIRSDVNAPRVKIMEAINVKLGRKLTPAQFYKFRLILKFLDLNQNIKKDPYA